MPRTAILLLLTPLILLVSGPVVLGATKRAGLAEPQPLIHEREGYYDIEVRTGLTDYLFSTEAGELRSAFLYFAPYGQRRDEMIADATTDPKSLARSFAPQGIFPFTVGLAGPGLNLEGPWEYRLLKREEEMVQLEFAKAIGNLRLKKIYTIRDDPSYTVDCELILSNSGGTALPIPWLKLLLGTDQFQVLLGKFITGEVRYLFDGERTETVPTSYGQFDGLGVVAKSAVLFLKVKEGPIFAPSLELDERGRKVLGIKAEGLELPPGEERHYRFILYAGRPKWALLRLSGLEGLVDVGPFSWALIGIVGFLDWLYAATGNYGWAIILFTIVVRIILFPLMRKQYYSMAKMQRLGPRLQQLQQRYKDERELLQKKMMELYRKEGINPLSGCLPLLIQFPILYVLWQAILYSAERVHLSPGFLWMTDLSVADPYYIIVVLNVVAMILQSWLFTPTTGGQRPNWLLILGMPIFMGFLLKSFPAGMWLYWLFTTILQIGQQWLINRELGRLGPVAIEPEVGPGAGEGGDEARS
ncbi:MAG: membrane protein insertase YidC [Candidatus Bipolaricaulia bacterium]